MTNKTTIDFLRIGTKEDLYKKLSKEWNLPTGFGNNLDALWDVATGYISLPQELVFENISLTQLETFGSFIDLFEEANEELGEEFQFSYSLKKD